MLDEEGVRLPVLFTLSSMKKTLFKSKGLPLEVVGCPIKRPLSALRPTIFWRFEEMEFRGFNFCFSGVEEGLHLASLKRRGLAERTAHRAPPQYSVGIAPPLFKERAACMWTSAAVDL